MLQIWVDNEGQHHAASFEVIAINLDLYQYYGERPMRFLGHPLGISFMEPLR